MKSAVFNWSGGKDSALALHQVLNEKQYSVECLLTSVNEHYDRVSMHGVRTELLEAQASSIGLPLRKLLLPEMPSMEVYNQVVGERLAELKSRGIDYSVYGDIFLEDLRAYREEQLAQVPMQAVFPIWGRNTRELLQTFINEGYKAVIVCINEKYLDASYAGRLLDQDFLNSLPAGVDPCGENGEYHTFVFDGPIFKQPVPFKLGEVVYRNYQPVSQSDDDNCGVSTPANYDTGFYFRDLLPA
ncbi:diphthine--ammonia ligase [Telluribacter sp. SYSU D00476]|uniref:Dph6-related ATP pyrophosphatase n=1 Tax=Telluribacter sp. SYSU D00476 TaxID=2811430 RepID=UPI001FF52A10|nr:diphthine--ammonia ligase [Telluribacter sp. SYSU D00476]